MALTSAAAAPPDPAPLGRQRRVRRGRGRPDRQSTGRAGPRSAPDKMAPGAPLLSSPEGLAAGAAPGRRGSGRHGRAGPRHEVGSRPRNEARRGSPGRIARVRGGGLSRAPRKMALVWCQCRLQSALAFGARGGINLNEIIIIII